jgi:hypothetical protein
VRNAKILKIAREFCARALCEASLRNERSEYAAEGKK